MPGPLPKPNARRRNHPTIPTTKLPAAGRKGRPPKPPAGYVLGEAGDQWWRWAWRLPQAAAWDAGAHYHLARRAQLEDDLATLEAVDVDIAELLGIEKTAAARELDFVIGRLKAMAGGRLAVMREMRELDQRLGLNPEALAKLRWTIVAPDSAASATKPDTPATNVRQIRAVDPAAAAG